MRHVDGLELPPLPPVPLATRLYASEILHRCVPRQLAFLAVRVLNEWRWRSPEYREWCKASMRYLLEMSPRASETDTLAKEWGYSTIKRSELLWRPWLAGKVQVDGVGALRAAKAQNRGVVLSFTHHGWFATLGSLREKGFELHIPVAPDYLAQPQLGYWGRRDRQHLINAALGATVFDAIGSFTHIRDLLQRGEVVAMSFDLPGTAETTFLGRTVYASSGLARTAKATRALIVPVTMRKHGDLAKATLEQPIDPDAFGSAEELHAAVVAQHEPAVLEWPEVLEWPLRRWYEKDPVRHRGSSRSGRSYPPAPASELTS